MTATTMPHTPAREASDIRPAPPPKPDWPLICDILSARMDQPDLLRLWPVRDD